MSELGKAIKFIVGGRYANRRGEYEVLQIKGNTMRVRYDDNTEQELTIDIQARIATNMTLEAAQLAPYKSSEARNQQFFFSLGFLAAHATNLEAFVPEHALGGFISSYALVKGRKPMTNQRGLYVHEPKVSKWGCELRVTFGATKEELDLLDFGPSVNIRDDPLNPDVSWRINNNGFWWRLLKFGFEMGNQQNKNVIEASIPNKYREHFRKGEGDIGA